MIDTFSVQLQLLHLLGVTNYMYFSDAFDRLYVFLDLNYSKKRCSD